MPTRKPSVGKLFETAGTTQSHQVLQLKDRVEELEEEIAQLRSGEIGVEDRATLEQQIQELTEQLANRDGIHEIEISLIDPDPNQPRQTITNVMIQARADSLREHGQLSPIILIPQENGRYTLFDGELRWKSAPFVPMPSLRSVFLKNDRGEDPAIVFRGQLLTRLHSEELHDLDLAEALIIDIQNHCPSLRDAADEIPKLLDGGIRSLRKAKRLSELSSVRQQPLSAQQLWIDGIQFAQPEVADIFKVLLELRLNPVSVTNNIFPLLKLPSDLKQTIRSTALESSKVREIAKLSPQTLNGVDEKTVKKIRQKITHRVVNENLSVSQVREVVKETIGQYAANSDEKPINLRMEKTLKQINAISVESEDFGTSDLLSMKEALLSKLAEVNSLLGSRDAS